MWEALAIACPQNSFVQDQIARVSGCCDPQDIPAITLQSDSSYLDGGFMMMIRGFERALYSSFDLFQSDLHQAQEQCSSGPAGVHEVEVRLDGSKERQADVLLCLVLLESSLQDCFDRMQKDPNLPCWQNV